MVVDVSKYRNYINDKNSKAFFERVWATPQEIYMNRLKAIGFTKCDKVLDAGCGFGQWTIALSNLCKEVIGVDNSEERLDVAKRIACDLQLNNVFFQIGDIQELTFTPNYFDAIFSYSAIYFTDVKKALRSWHGLLEKNGYLYINTNDLSWYINQLTSPNSNRDEQLFNRNMVLETIEETINYFAFGERDCRKRIVTPKKAVVHELKSLGFKILADGSDGTIDLVNVKPKVFFKKPSDSFEFVWEVLCQKQ